MNEEAGNGGPIKSALLKLLKFIFEGRGDDPLNLLKEDYRKERLLAAGLRAHAENMPYPAYRESLKELSDLSVRGADKLGAKIQAMGEGLPDISEPEPPGGSLWEKLAHDVEEIDDLYYRYLALAGEGEDFEELVAGLLEDKSRQSSAIQRLMSGLHGYSL